MPYPLPQHARVEDGDSPYDFSQSTGSLHPGIHGSTNSSRTLYPSSPQYNGYAYPESQYESHELYPQGSRNPTSANMFSPSRPAVMRHSNNSRGLDDLYPESIQNSPWATPTRGSLIWQENGEVLSPSPSPYAAPSPYLSQEVLNPLFKGTSSNPFDRDWNKEGSIQKLHDRDDKGHMRKWKRVIYLLTPILSIATLAAYWVYFSFRIYCVLRAQAKAGQSYPLAWVFIGVELSVAVPIFFNTFWAVFVYKKRNRPKLRLLGDDVPKIDVFITCCGEDIDLVLDTARAACNVDYPQDRYRVIILDDAKCDGLSQAVDVLSYQSYPNLYYRARTKIPGQPHHFKAGNLNYGLDEVTRLPGGASPFIAALDADMIPEREWLRAIIPHMLIDNKVALACPPQLFYNTPPGDPLCQSLDFFVHVSEPIKDALGVAWCTGSGYIVRRDALDEIGQFPKGSLAEDVATSTLMLGRGWKTAYIHEPLQFGTVPDSFGSHLKQRTRWAIGTVDTSFKLNFCLYGDAVRDMTFFQRLSGFIYAFLSLFNIFLTLSLFAMPIVLISGKPLVAYATDNQLRWLIRACFAALFINRLCEMVLFLPAGYATGQRGARYQLWMSPYIALSIIRSFMLPTWLGGVTQAFKPTGSLESELNERDAKTRAPLFRRLRVTAVNYMAGYHIAYVYFCLVAVTLSTMRCIVENRQSLKEQLVCLVTHGFWPPMAWILVASAFWIPITYAIDPPKCKSREELLVRDPKTGVARPTEESKRIGFKPQTAMFEMEYTLTTIFTAICFAATFFF